VFLDVGFWFSEGTDAIEVRSVSESERLSMTVDRDQPDLFRKLAVIGRVEWKRRKISRAEFARRIGTRRESFYKVEEGKTTFLASTLL